MPDPFRTEYYDAEAPAYDATRGGPARAAAAAVAVLSLVPRAGVCVDVAGGTGIVSAALAARGLDVLVVDRSTGMLGIAGGRLPGRVLAADADRLPFANGSVDLVTMIWLLHLVPGEADQIIAEAARVLRPSGSFVTTVDKDLAHGTTRRTDADERGRVGSVLAGFGLELTATTSFRGETRWTRGDGGPQVFHVAAFRRPRAVD